MILKKDEIHNGIQIVHRFDNDLGASVVSHDFSYGGKKGLWEIAPIEFTSPDPEDWEISDHNAVTGFLTQKEVDEKLFAIQHETL